MDGMLIFWILIGLGALWTVIWLKVLGSKGDVVPYTDIAPKVSRLRKQLTYSLMVVGIVAIALAWQSMPYAGFRTGVLGEPQQTIPVTGHQWYWTFGEENNPVAPEIAVGVPVAFDVTSADVNHGFVIYSPEGRIVTQTQSMPGYTNRLIYSFSESGTYTIRCLELCGVPHDVMTTQLVVK
jgi:cytochrome c oxidase subunit 2